MARGPYNHVGNEFNRVRVALNENADNIWADIKEVDTNARRTLASAIRAEELAGKADKKSQEVLDYAENFQSQLDSIIRDGDSSLAANQARVDLNNHEFSSLKERIDSEQSKIDSSYVSLSMFPRLEGEETDDARINRAIAFAPDNGEVRLEQGETYLIENLQTRGKSITFNANNANIMPAKNTNTIHFVGGWGDILDVTSIREVSYAFGGSGTGTPVHEITVNAPEGLDMEAGEKIRVVSDDVIVGARPGTGGRERRRASFGVIGAVDENKIYLTDFLYSELTTNIRVAKLSKAKINIKNLTIKLNPLGGPEQWSNNLIVIEAAEHPVIENVICEGGYGSFITFRGCYGYVVSNVFAKDLLNQPSTGSYGYGINDIGSEYGRVFNAFFSNVRHGYTTNSDAVPAGSNAIERFGSTAFSDVTMKVVGSSNSGADTHEEAYGVTFTNTEVYSAYRGEDSSGAGFSLRGKMIRVINGLAEGCRYGAHIFEQFPNATDGIKLDNFTTRRIRGHAVIINTAGNGQRSRNVEITNSDLSIIRGNRIVEVVRGDVTIKNTALKAQTGSNYCFGIYQQDSNVTTEDVRFTYTGTGTHPRAFRAEGESVLTTDKTNIKFNGLPNAAVIEDNSYGAPTVLSRVTVDRSVTTNVGSSTMVQFSSANNFNLDYSLISQSLSGNQNLTDRVGLSLHDHIFLNATPSVDSIGFNEFPMGKRMGQLLVIKNDSSANKLVIRSSSSFRTELRKSQPIILDPKDSVTLVWRNSLWVSL